MSSSSFSLVARQADALRELANLGSAKAASMLARLVGDVGVLVDVPLVLSASPWQVGWLMGGHDVKVLAATFAIEGDLFGELWWVLRTDDAHRLGHRLLQRPGVSGLLSASVGAALTEAANIVASACLSSVGTMTHCNLLPSMPRVSETTVGSLVGTREHAMDKTVLSTTFTATNAPTFSGWLFMLFEDSARDKIIQRLGV
jgi:chemotaxis protein CheC